MRRQFLVSTISFTLFLVGTVVGFSATVVVRPSCSIECNRAQRRREVDCLNPHDDTGGSIASHSQYESFLQQITKLFGPTLLAVAVVSAQVDPAVATTPSASVPAPVVQTSTVSTTAARIHLNSLPPTTVAIRIGDLPVIGSVVSGTYAKTDNESLILKKMLKRNSKNAAEAQSAPVIVESPRDKVAAIKDITSRGHFEFEVDAKTLHTHLDVDVAAPEPGVAVIRVVSPSIPQLPFRNSASDLVPPAAGTLKKFRETPKRQSSDATTVVNAKSAGVGSPTAAHIYLNSLPPDGISVEIEDLFVVGKLLSGFYTKIDDDAVTVGGNNHKADDGAAIIIESPKDKVAAIKNIVSKGHLEFVVDGLVNTHLAVDIATDSQGSATILLQSPIIPALPFQNAASF